MIEGDRDKSSEEDILGTNYKESEILQAKKYYCGIFEQAQKGWQWQKFKGLKFSIEGAGSSTYLLGDQLRKRFLGLKALNFPAI